MILRNNKKAFTLVELLTVMGIIALLVSIAIPSLSAAKKYAKESACRATINTMEQSLFNFQKDQGAYPSSTPSVDQSGSVTLGAHKLAEALFGTDMLGYQKDHFYRIGENASYPETYGKPIDGSGRLTTRTIYMPTDNLELTTLPKLKALKGYNPSGTAVSAVGTYSYDKCWNHSLPIITDGLKGDESLPLLYFKANTRGSMIASPRGTTYNPNDIYRFSDNEGISMVIPDPETGLADWEPKTISPPNLATLDYTNFTYYMWNANTGAGNISSATARPHKADSFVIISAGFDQVYGTNDDICNFDFKAGK